MRLVAADLNERTIAPREPGFRFGGFFAGRGGFETHSLLIIARYGHASPSSNLQGILPLFHGGRAEDGSYSLGSSQAVSIPTYPHRREGVDNAVSFRAITWRGIPSTPLNNTTNCKTISHLSLFYR